MYGVNCDEHCTLGRQWRTAIYFSYFEQYTKKLGKLCSNSNKLKSVKDTTYDYQRPMVCYQYNTA
jgi:hypothetical protein